MFANTVRSGVISAATTKVKSGSAPVFVYLYKWNPPVLDGVAGAWHVADVPMALFNADRTPQSFGGGEEARSMSFDVARSWINFVRNGNPSNPGIPDWTPFTPDNTATMLFDDYSTLGIQHDKTLLELMANQNKS
jgi:para-nitrobenzyl esterase